MSITLDRFTMPMEEGAAADGRMQMAAMLTIQHGGASHEVKALTRIGTGSAGPTFDPEWVTIPGTTTSVGLSEIVRNNEDPSKSSGELVFKDITKPMPIPREIFTVEFSVKPFISLVWIGVITMVAGFGFSIVRYTRLLKQQSPLAQGKRPPSSDVKPEILQVQPTDANSNQT